MAESDGSAIDAIDNGVDIRWHHCNEDGCDYKAKHAGNLKTHKVNVHDMMFDGTTAIKIDATTRQSKQATSKNTKQMFMILMFDGTTAIKTDTTTWQR